MLTENPWNGGAGLSYDSVAKMTPDQIYHRLCDKDVLKVKGGRRIAKASSDSLVTDGTLKGRAADGTPITAKVRVGGKSVARRLMEEQAEQRKRGV
jgi:hypothetical protein